MGIQVFTVGYRKVRQEEWKGLPRDTAVELELKDGEGIQLANGLYYVVVTTGPGRSVGKLMILR